MLLWLVVVWISSYLTATLITIILLALSQIKMLNFVHDGKTEKKMTKNN